MTVKDVVKCMRLEDRLEIKQKSNIIWKGYVKEIDLDNDKLMEKQCLIIEPFNENKEFGNRLTIENDIKIDDSFEIDKNITVGELLYNYASDTTIIRIVETSGVFLEIEEIIYEDYMSEFENDDLLNKRVVWIDSFIYDKDDAGLIIYI